VQVDGREIPNYIANVRDSDNKVMGIVSGKYQIVQNQEAFAFTDALLSNDLGIPITYESAGSFKGGKRVFLSARLPETSILGDSFTPYLFFTNNHDGGGAVRVAITPVRMVCTNMLSLVLDRATRSWSARHMGEVLMKVDEAKIALTNAVSYMKALEEEAKQLAKVKVGFGEVNMFTNRLFPINAEAQSPLQITRMQEQRDIFLDIYHQKDDLQNFNGTGWGFLQAVADYESHVGAQRESSSFSERRLMTFVDGRVPRFQVAQQLIQEAA
jgi:phage/plasmid-like protein (TIGR03299 family)